MNNDVPKAVAACCGNFGACTMPCVPRANHWQHVASEAQTSEARVRVLLQRGADFYSDYDLVCGNVIGMGRSQGVEVGRWIGEVRDALRKGACSWCGDSGHVTTPTGEWRGRCACDAGRTAPPLDGADPEKNTAPADPCKNCERGGVCPRNDCGRKRSSELMELYGRPKAAPAQDDDKRASLLWVLWHHQGGSSAVGQPIRAALGMGEHDSLTDAQVKEAQACAERKGWSTAAFHRDQAWIRGALLLKGIGKINGDGWKDTTKVGEVVYAWNRELPEPYKRGQFPRLGNPVWTASQDQYAFYAVDDDEAIAVVDRMIEELRMQVAGLKDTAAYMTSTVTVDAEACVRADLVGAADKAGGLAEPAPIDRLKRHALPAGDCPEQCQVVLLSTVRRVLGGTPPSTAA